MNNEHNIAFFDSLYRLSTSRYGNICIIYLLCKKLMAILAIFKSTHNPLHKMPTSEQKKNK